jgi:hypothetical protein
MRPAPFLLALVALGGVSTARAESWDYTFSVPEGREAKFELPFPVQYEGSVTIDATWTGPRLLFFGVEGPGGISVARRSGPSPQRLELSADAAAIARGTGWKITLKALPARGEASGRVRVTAPDAPAVVAAREAALHPPPPPPPPPPAWTLPRAAPPSASPDLLRLYEAVETLRAGVLNPAGANGDACTWQIEFLRFVVAARDRLGDSGTPPDLPSLRYFARLANAIRGVSQIKTSRDPILAGPVPVSREQRRDWLIARNEIVRPIERSLDELTELLRGGHAPALEDEPWLPRFTACLTACERFYDERVRLGGEENAPNRDLAAGQWARIADAGRVFDALSPWLREPQVP